MARIHPYLITVDGEHLCNDFKAYAIDNHISFAELSGRANLSSSWINGVKKTNRADYSCIERACKVIGKKPNQYVIEDRARGDNGYLRETFTYGNKRYQVYAKDPRALEEKKKEKIEELQNTDSSIDVSLDELARGGCMITINACELENDVKEYVKSKGMTLSDFSKIVGSKRRSFLYDAKRRGRINANLFHKVCKKASLNPYKYLLGECHDDNSDKENTDDIKETLQRIFDRQEKTLNQQENILTRLNSLEAQQENILTKLNNLEAIWQ